MSRAATPACKADALIEALAKLHRSEVLDDLALGHPFERSKTRHLVARGKPLRVVTANASFGGGRTRGHSPTSNPSSEQDHHSNTPVSVKFCLILLKKLDIIVP